MKGGTGRIQSELKDFTGGQVTRPPEKGIDVKYSIDCLNVYSESVKLRRRDGFTVENSTATTGQGNGFYNWVKNATDQVQVVYFGSQLSKIDVTSGAWDGTLDNISPNPANGTSFTNAIMHFVTFNGTLIMTTENRDKPQYIRVTDSSHFDIETGGAGTGPFAKYCQVWKNHLFLLNCGGGSELNEECSSITSWTDNDVGTGVSVQTTFDGKSTFRLTGGSVSGDNAKRTKDIGTFSDNYTFEFKTNFASLKAVSNGDYAETNIYNGNILFKTRLSTDGLEIFDGTNWNEVGTNVVSTGTWITWKFLITGGTTTASKVDIYQNGSPIGLQFSCANADTTNDGQIDLFARAGASGTVCDYYIDYMYVNSVSATTNYLQNPQFDLWGPLNGSCATFSTASQSYLQLSDNAAFNLSDKDFTIEMRINRGNVTTTKIGLYTQGTDTANQIFFGIVNDALLFSCNTGGTTIAYHSTASLSWNTSEWYELALVRDGSSLQMLRRGQNLSVSATTELSSNALPDFSSNIFIGASSGTANSFTGSIDEYRVSTVARYSAGYNVATSNFTSDASTSLLLHLDSNFTDSSSNAFSVTTALGVANTTGPLGVFSWSAPTSLTLVREGTTIKEGTYSLKITGVGSVSQTISMPSGISGQSAYIGGWIKPTSGAQYQLVVTDGASTYPSPIFTGASTDWEYRTLQFTAVSSATNIVVNLKTISSNTYYLDSFSLIPAGTVAYSSDFSDRAQRSAVGIYNDFDGTDSGTNDIITPGDVGLTGSFILNDRMYVTKAWSIHRFSYTQSFPLIDIKQVKKTVGTKSPRSIRNVDTKEGELVIFLGSDKRLYLFDGLTSVSISDEMTVNNGLSSVYFDNINASALDKVFAIVYQDLGLYELFVPIGGATTPTHSIVYDYNLKSFWPWSNRVFTSGDVSDNGSGARVVYALASTAGQICLLNSGNSDNGSSIDSYWTSTRIGSSLKLNRIDEIDVETPSQLAAPTFTWRGDYETNFVATQSIASGKYSHSFAPKRIDNLIQFKIADNTTTASWKIWAITMTERLIGVGK